MSAVSASATRPLASRLAFLDVARALAVLAMLVANLANVFLLVERPHWLGHNAGDELLPLDFPAPMFQFLIGVSLALFLVRRGERDSPVFARLLAARRFALLILVGIALDAGAVHRFELRWGVLQTLGLGGLIATALAPFSDWVIVLAAATLLALHYGPGDLPVHESAIDSLAFMPLTLVGFVLGRPLARGDRRTFQSWALVVALVSLTLALAMRSAGVPFNKLTGSSSFVTIALALSAAVVGGLSELESRGVVFWSPLVVLGANALTAWVLQYVAVYYPVHLVLGDWPEFSESAGELLVTGFVAILAVLTLALARRGFRIPL